ncbi:MAG TPA: lipopolysaccharide kinase InaA family protein, partial [Labilithrix sp.]|nr:lipopolysaccharide kinase InaA family protein [Labilithrix sp.]
MTAAVGVGGWALHSKEGEGSSGTVFRASRADGATAAIKIARTAAPAGRRETLLLARAQRRWGPALLGAGHLASQLLGPDGVVLASGAWWSATTWMDGDVLGVRGVNRSEAKRKTLAAVVAHGVGRGLAELHHAGIRHADVKPANILLRRGAPPKRDRADDRGATLVDLDLAADIADTMLGGGTPRCLAPELRAGEPATPAADLYA